jgi:hypothetical protein
MTYDSGPPRPPWAIFGLVDVVAALRAELSAGELGTPPAGESMEVTAEFSVEVAPGERGEPRFWVVTAGQPGAGGAAAPHRVTVTVTRAPGASSGYRRSAEVAESTRGWDDSVGYRISDDEPPAAAPEPEATRGWDEGDRP